MPQASQCIVPLWKWSTHLSKARGTSHATAARIWTSALSSCVLSTIKKETSIYCIIMMRTICTSSYRPLLPTPQLRRKLVFIAAIWTLYYHVYHMCHTTSVLSCVPYVPYYPCIIMCTIQYVPYYPCINIVCTTSTILSLYYHVYHMYHTTSVLSPCVPSVLYYQLHNWEGSWCWL